MSIKQAATVSLLAILLAGCASTEHILETDADPFEPYNRAMFAVNDTVDTLLLKPVAQGYRTVMPDTVEKSISNVFGNVSDVGTVVNDVLQLKLQQALQDTTRVVFNTTFGLGGLFDVATHMGLPKHREDFGQTLGYWGVGEGYYVVLPLLGPSTTRDALGRVVDMNTDPVAYLSPVAHRVAASGVRVVSGRAELLRAERAFADDSIDKYGFMREFYLQKRRNLTYDGNPPRPAFDFDLGDE